MDLNTARGLDIREGDLITIQMVVREVFPDYLQLTLKPLDVACEKGGGVHVAINHGAIVAHDPKALQEGQGVKFRGNPDSVRGRIVRIDGDKAWVRWSESYDDVQPLVILEREDR